MDIVDVEPNLNSELKSYFRGMRDGFVQVGEKKWLYTKKFRNRAEGFKNFKVRSDDIWITGYPRSGTTLTEELAWLLSHNLDFDAAKETSLAIRVRFFEGSIVSNNELMKEISAKFGDDEVFHRMENALKLLNEDRSRRVIKTHLPFELLPEDVTKKGCKIIYVCRYPKDVCVSHFFLQSSSRHMDFCGDFKKYWSYFRNGYCIFGPYFEHVKQGFEKIGSKNFLFVFFEDFKKDKGAYIKKLAHFLEVPISNEQLKNLEEFIDIQNFQKTAKIVIKNNDNEEVSFIRNGKVGGWRDHFDEEMSKEADEWIEENTKKIGMRYPQQEKP